MIGSNDPRHFNEALQNLLAQMVQSMSAALTLIWNHQQLMEVSEKNEALLKNASDGIHILDENGVLLEASYQFCDMLGYACDEMIGMHAAQWYVEKNAEQLRESIAQQADCESVLLHDICTLAVQHTNMRLVWVGTPDTQGTFRILAQAGETAYLEGIRISRRDDLPEGLGPAGRAWRTQEKIFGSAFSMSSNMVPWQERAARLGIEASATFPLYRGGVLWVLISFYWGKECLFDED